MKKTIQHICRTVAAALLALSATGCTLTGSDKEARDAARQWAEAYFNGDYHEAERLTAGESRKWLLLAASNTTDAMLQLLQAEGGAAADIRSFAAASDTTASATVGVSRYMLPATIGGQPATAADGLFVLNMVRRNGRWLVKIGQLPRAVRTADRRQNGTQSRD